MPELRQEQEPRRSDGTFAPGVSGNPGGTSAARRARAAVINAEDPERLRVLLSAVWQRGVAGSNADARLYCEVIGVLNKDAPANIDLSKLDDEERAVFERAVAKLS